MKARILSQIVDLLDEKLVNLGRFTNFNNDSTQSKKRWRSYTLMPILILSLILSNPFSSFAQITIDGNPSDWATIFTNPAVPIKLKVIDPVNNGNTDNIWTQGSAATNLIENWTWKNGSTNDKGDIHNAGVALIGTKLHFFADRYANNGDVSLGMWVFVDPVSLNPDGTFSGTHVNGDLLITAEFVNGGSVADRKAYVWTDGVLVEKVVGDVVLSLRSNAIGYPSPFPYQAKFPNGNGANYYPERSFLEGFVDLNAVPGASPCFAAFLIETRNSQSLSASLEDLVLGSISSRPTVTVADQTVCSGGSATFTANVVGAFPPFMYKWNGGAPTTSNTFTINNATASTSVTVVAIDDKGCVSPMKTAQLTVNQVSPGTIAGGGTLCSPFDPSAFTSTTPGSGSGTITYQWQSSTTDATTGFSNITGATSETYDSPAVAVTTWFRRVASSTLNNVPCSANSNVLMVVPNEVTPGEIGGGGTLCSPFDPAAFTSTTPGSGGGAITYQWQSSTTDATTGFSNINGATLATYDAPAVAVTTWFRRVAISTLNTVPCSSNSNVLMVAPNAITPGVIAGGGTLCSPFDPAAFTSTTPGSGGGTITYQWQKSIVSNSSDFENINGATSATYDAPAVAVTTWFRRVATSTLNNVPCSANSNVLAVIPNAINPGAISGGGTLCSPFDPAAFVNTTSATGGGTISYQWQSSTTSSTTGFSNINGATSATYDAPAVAVTTWFRRVATSTLNTVPCSANSIVLMVMPNIVTPGTIAGNQNLCLGEDTAAFTVTQPATVPQNAVLTYKWQSNTTGCNGTFEDINGATSATYDPGIVNVTTYYRRMAISTLNNVVCSEVSNCLVVTYVDCGPLCTYTQGYYGNSGGMACSPDGQFTTLQMIQNSINRMPNNTMYLGRGSDASATGGSFTAMASDASKLITLLPGGGSANSLGGDYGPNNVQPLKNGKIFNNLLSQTITMALNIYMTDNASKSVGNFSLAGSGGKYIVTIAKSNGSSCVSPTRADCLLDPNAIKSFYMPSNVITALPNSKKVSDLFQMAKNALGGELPVGVSYSDIAKAVDAINNAFDKCRFFIEFSDEAQVCPVPIITERNVSNLTETEEVGFELYPVPFNDHLMLKYHFNSESPVEIQVYDMRGVLISSGTEKNVDSNKQSTIKMDFKTLPGQLYFVKISSDKGTFVKKVISK